MRIKDRPEFKRKSAVLSYKPDDLVFDAVKVMSEKNYGAVVICGADGKPVGIVTERDLMRRLLAEDRDPKQTRLGEIMSTELKVAREDDDLLDWLRQMSNDRFRHLPVVDDEGRVISLMSQGDFVSFTWPQLMQRVGEQARATFDVNPQMFTAIGGAIVFFLALLTFFTAIG